MSLTDDPNDPRLTRGADEKPVGQAEVYLVLSEAERAKGFVRPVRQSYIHVGVTPQGELRDLTDDEHNRLDQFGYVKFEPYANSDSIVGRYWTQAQLDARGCGAVTKMALALAETYARDPAFYGGTYCVGCRMHRPVNEFRWIDDNGAVGAVVGT